MTQAPERIAIKWKPGDAITSGPLMEADGYTQFVRADLCPDAATVRAEALREAAECAEKRRRMLPQVTPEAALALLETLPDTILALIGTPAPDTAAPVSPQEAAKVLLNTRAYTETVATYAAAREYPSMGFINAAAVVGAALRALAEQEQTDG